MRLLARLEQRYADLRRNRSIRYFAVFCRVVLALGFIPSGLVKVQGERFTGLPSNHPLGHYFDALQLTGAYYTFIGVAQLTAAALLLVPRTALLGALLYFPIILNITVLAYAVRFEGTRITTLMLLANVFLLVWDYDRLKHILSPRRSDDDDHVVDKAGAFPTRFFAFVFAAAASVIAINAFLYDVRPGNSQLECTNACKSNANPSACMHFCGCIYDAGDPLRTCLDEYEKAK